MRAGEGVADGAAVFLILEAERGVLAELTAMAEGEEFQQAIAHIRDLARDEKVRVTQHAQQEMAEDGVTLDEVLSAVEVGAIIEHYPVHRRGACCLIHGHTPSGRSLHIVCTTDTPVLILITVYEPTPPKWITPTQRRSR